MVGNYLIVGLVIVAVLFIGFFLFRFIRNQMYELKLELLNTIREREKLEKHTLKEGTRMITVNSEAMNDNEIELLIGKINMERGVYQIDRKDSMITFMVDMDKKENIKISLEAFRDQTGMKFTIS